MGRRELTLQKATFEAVSQSSVNPMISCSGSRALRATATASDQVLQASCIYHCSSTHVIVEEDVGGEPFGCPLADELRILLQGLIGVGTMVTTVDPMPSHVECRCSCHRPPDWAHWHVGKAPRSVGVIEQLFRVIGDPPRMPEFDHQRPLLICHERTGCHKEVVQAHMVRGEGWWKLCEQRTAMDSEVTHAGEEFLEERFGIA